MGDSLQKDIESDTVIKTISSSVAMELKDKHDSFLWIPEEWWTHVVLPVLIPIFAFVLLKLLERIIERRRKIRHFVSIENYLINWIELIEVQVEKQVKSYREHSISVKNHAFPAKGIESYDLMLEKFKHFDSVQLVNFFLAKKGDKKTFMKMLFSFENSISAIQRTKNSINEAIRNWNDYIANSSDRWNENFMQIREVLHQIDQGRASQSQGHFYHEIIMAFNLFNSENKGKEILGIEVTMAKLIEPLATKINDRINMYPDDNLLRRLMECFISAKKIYIDRCYFHENVSNVLDESSNIIENAYLAVKNVKSELNKYRFSVKLFS